jgi:hypothetical protein
MTTLEKPSLEETYLEHFGTKGMRWGVRKIRRDEDQRKKTFGQKAKTAAKVTGIAAVAVGGAIAVSYLIGNRGRTKVGELAVHNYVVGKERKAQAEQMPFRDLGKKFRDAVESAKPKDLPSPDSIMQTARNPNVQINRSVAGHRRLADNVLKNKARMQKEVDDMYSTPEMENIRRRLMDPNYIWEF